MTKKIDLYIESPYEQWSKFWYKKFVDYTMRHSDYIHALNPRDRVVTLVEAEGAPFRVQFINSHTADYISQGGPLWRPSNMLYWNKESEETLYSKVMDYWKEHGEKQ